MICSTLSGNHLLSQLHLYLLQVIHVCYIVQQQHVLAYSSLVLYLLAVAYPILAQQHCRFIPKTKYINIVISITMPNSEMPLNTLLHSFIESNSMRFKVAVCLLQDCSCLGELMSL